jgi:hypothetical protein
MLPLYEKVTRYLVRGDYRMHDASPGFARGEYAGEDPRDKPMRLLVWVEDEMLPASRTLDTAGRQARAQREDTLLREMIAEMQGHNDAVGYYVVPSRQGLSAEFIASATETLQRGGRDKRGGIRIPSEFFDTDYKLDTRTGSRAKASALGQLFDRVKSRRRVAQPFMRRSGLGPNDRKIADGDIVEHLDVLFRDPVSRATLRIIDGPAGGGKSVAFETLVVALYDEFMEAKKRQIERPRPIVFLPDHMRGENLAGYVDNVIDAAMEAEAAKPVEAEQLKFLLNYGHGVWMFDGLDEFFGNDNNFFDFLGNELSNPDSRAQVLICSRDSLLTSSSALANFVTQQLAKGTAIELYELAPWGPDAWRKLAWMELESGLNDKQSSPRVEAFVAALSGSKELSQLASLPFYCTVLLDEFRKNSKLSADPLGVLDTIIERMLAREGGKLVFEWREFVDLDVVDDVLAAGESMLGFSMADGKKGREVMEQLLDKAGRENMRELLGEVAHGRVRQPNAGEVEVADLRGVLGPAYVDGKLVVADSARVTTAIVQFAFFGAGKKPGAVDFSHPILAEHLAAGYALTVLRRAAEHVAEMPDTSGLSRVNTLKGAVRQAIGSTKLEPGSVFHRSLARGIAADPVLQDLVETAASLMGKEDRALSAALVLARKG